MGCREEPGLCRGAPEVKANVVRLNPTAVGAMPKDRKMLSVLS